MECRQIQPPPRPVLGIVARTPRPTRSGALWLALLVTLPLAGLLLALEALLWLWPG
jgi:fatty acid desaturase